MLDVFGTLFAYFDIRCIHLSSPEQESISKWIWVPMYAEASKPGHSTHAVNVDGVPGRVRRVASRGSSKSNCRGIRSL